MGPTDAALTSRRSETFSISLARVCARFDIEMRRDPVQLSLEVVGGL